MIDSSFLDQLNKFSLVINKRVTSSYSGPRKSLALGKGMTFKDHRIYARGDDFRSIDWKVYARTDDLYIKTFEEERSLNVHIIMDASNSMKFGKPISKFDYASMIGVGTAYLAMRGNEKFQFATFSDTLEVFQPKRGMSQLASMIDYLNNLKTKGSSRLLDAVIHYKKLIGSKSLLVMTSDFMYDIADIKEALLRLGNHQIKVIQVLDPIEKDLKIDGDFNFKDSETNDLLRTFVGQNLRSHYQKLLTDHSAKIQETCDTLGIDFFQITTDTSVFDSFYKIMQ
jgi:uncharacterized protein (DUF58 family)